MRFLCPGKVGMLIVGYKRIMDKKMETTIIGFIGVMEKKMDTTSNYYNGFILFIYSA